MGLAGELDENRPRNLPIGEDGLVELEAGAEDVDSAEDGSVEVITSPEDFQEIKGERIPYSDVGTVKKFIS